MELAKQMLSCASSKGWDAGAVRFDSWFCGKDMEETVYLDIGYDVVTSLKTPASITE